MKDVKLESLQLTHTGLFSERCGALFDVLLRQDGPLDVGLGLGMSGNGEQVGILVQVGGVSTAFTPREARSLAEVLQSTISQVEPPTANLKAIFNHLIAGCEELSAEVEEFERARTAQKLN